MQPTAFRSKRIARTSTITLKDTPESIFPLFGPVREKDWAPGWEPQIVYSDSAWIEEHMVFTARSHHGHEPDSTWTVSRYAPGEALVEYTVVAPERLWRITIQCRPGDGPRATLAEITYTFTGLTERGNELDEAAMSRMFQRDLKDWEEQINRHLEAENRSAPG
jgi:hypothetical protein